MAGKMNRMEKFLQQEIFYTNAPPGKRLKIMSKFLTFYNNYRSKFPALFEEPILCTSGCWYVAVASISGPSSDCGSCGYSSVKINEQVPLAIT